MTEVCPRRQLGRKCEKSSVNKSQEQTVYLQRKTDELFRLGAGDVVVFGQNAMRV